MATRTLNLSDLDVSAESRSILKGRDILSLSDANTGVEVLTVGASDALTDIDVGIDFFCLSIQRSINVSDTDIGAEGLLVFGGITPIIPIITPQPGYTPDAMIFALFVSDSNMGVESLHKAPPAGFSNGFSNGFEGQGIGCLTP